MPTTRTSRTALADRSAALDQGARRSSRASWQDTLGDLLDPHQVQQRLGVTSTDEVTELVSHGQLLALVTKEGNQVFPDFQFANDGKPYQIIGGVLSIFDDIISTYTVATWLMTPKTYLRDQTPIDWLRGGNSPEPILAGARRSAARLSH